MHALETGARKRVAVKVALDRKVGQGPRPVQILQPRRVPPRRHEQTDRLAKRAGPDVVARRRHGIQIRVRRSEEQTAETKVARVIVTGHTHHADLGGGVFAGTSLPTWRDQARGFSRSDGDSRRKSSTALQFLRQTTEESIFAGGEVSQTRGELLRNPVRGSVAVDR